LHAGFRATLKERGDFGRRRGRAAKGLAMFGSLAFALVLAAGVPAAQPDGPHLAVTAGYSASNSDSGCLPARGDSVIASCTAIIERDPNFAPAYFNRGVAYAHKGEHDKAIADYSKTIELDPKVTQRARRSPITARRWRSIRTMNMPGPACGGSGRTDGAPVFIYTCKRATRGPRAGEARFRRESRARQKPEVLRRARLAFRTLDRALMRSTPERGRNIQRTAAASSLFFSRLRMQRARPLPAAT
jgi:tetratricopeptide (TPR) repeat protein